MQWQAASFTKRIRVWTEALPADRWEELKSCRLTESFPAERNRSPDTQAIKTQQTQRCGRVMVQWTVFMLQNEHVPVFTSCQLVGATLSRYIMKHMNTQLHTVPPVTSCRSHDYSHGLQHASHNVSTWINFKLPLTENSSAGTESIFRPDGLKELCPVLICSFSWAWTGSCRVIVLIEVWLNAFLTNQYQQRKLTHCLGRADVSLVVSSHSFLSQHYSEMCWCHSDSPAPPKVSLVSSETQDQSDETCWLRRDRSTRSWICPNARLKL